MAEYIVKVSQHHTEEYLVNMKSVDGAGACAQVREAVGLSQLEQLKHVAPPKISSVMTVSARCSNTDCREPVARIEEFRHSEHE